MKQEESIDDILALFGAGEMHDIPYLHEHLIETSNYAHYSSVISEPPMSSPMVDIPPLLMENHPEPIQILNIDLTAIFGDKAEDVQSSSSVSLPLTDASPKLCISLTTNDKQEQVWQVKEEELSAVIPSTPRMLHTHYSSVSETER
jgi:hypothetical protein